ncbi:MAG: hypothetical protein AAF664_22350 [Planctomycetota bacterium]
MSRSLAFGEVQVEPESFSTPKGGSMRRFIPSNSLNRLRSYLRVHSAKWLLAAAMAAGTAASCVAGDYLDLSFAGTGATELNLSERELSEGLHVDSTGRIYVVGFTKALTIQYEGLDAVIDYENQFIARYLSDGSLDTSFGGFGDAPAGVAIVDFQMKPGQIAGIVTLDDDSLMTVTVITGAGNQHQLVVSRFLEDGLLDESFGQLGRSVIDMGTNFAYDRAQIQLVNDQIYVVSGGYAVRINLDGTLDGGFAGDGILAKDDFVGAYMLISDFAVWQNHLIVATHTYSDAPTPVIELCGFDLNGNPDNGFGSGGVIDLSAHAVSNWPSTKIAVNDQQITAGFDNQVARVGFDGVLDESFGYGGVMPLLYQGKVTDLILQPYGMTTVAFKMTSVGSENQYAIRRMLFDGLPDESFGNSNGVWKGWLQLPWGQLARAGHLHGYANGKVLMAGEYTTAPGAIKNATLLRTEAFSFETELPEFDGDGFTTHDPTHGGQPPQNFDQIVFPEHEFNEFEIHEFEAEHLIFN